MDHLREYILGQQQQRLLSIESKLDRLSAQVEELITWTHRAALLGALWVGAVGINMSPQSVGQYIANVLGAMTK